MKKEQEVSATRASEPLTVFNGELPFVGRQREFDLVESSLRNLGHGGNQETVICFYGPLGIGKSRLLKEINERYRFSEDTSSSERQTITALVDYHNLENGDNSSANQKALIRGLWQQLTGQCGWLGLRGLRHEGASVDEMASDFVSQVQRENEQGRIAVILFDDIDVLSGDLLEWLETEIIEHLDENLFVCTAKYEERRWRPLNVRTGN